MIKISLEDIQKIFPQRKQDSHKGTYGKILTVAGCEAMPGAAYLCAYSSLLVGAGYSALASVEKVINITACKAPELVYLPLIKTSEGTVSAENIDYIQEKFSEYTAVVIGPGLSRHISTAEFVHSVIKKLSDLQIPFIIDADALNCCSDKGNFLPGKNSVITPHVKELSRLLKVSPATISANRAEFAKISAKKYNTITVLKGNNTLIALPCGEIYMNPTGNSGLATAGTGDILAGMITGFSGQGLGLKESALLGVYLHGLSADIAVKELTEYSLTSSSLMKYIPLAIKQIITMGLG